MIKYIKIKFHKYIYQIPETSQLGYKAFSQMSFFSIKKKIIIKIFLYIYRVNIPKYLNNIFSKKKNIFSKELFISITNTAHENSKEIKFIIDNNTRKIKYLEKKSNVSKTKSKIKNESKILIYLKKKKLNLSPKLISINKNRQEFLNFNHTNTNFDKPKIIFLKKLIQNRKVNLDHWINKIKRLKTYDKNEFQSIKKIIKIIPKNLQSRYVIEHGDFAPWNLLEDKNKNVIAIDWEFGELQSLPFIDIIHFQSKIDFLLNHKKYFVSNFIKLTKNNNFKSYSKKLSINGNNLNYHLKIAYIFLMFRYYEEKKKNPYTNYLLRNLDKFLNTNFYYE